MYQNFKFKIKDEFLPQIIQDSIVNGLIIRNFFDIYQIDQKYFRKLKLQNIQNEISDDEKKLVEFLINEDFVHFLTKEEYEKEKNNWSYRGPVGMSGSSGTMGVAGVAGSSGTYGVSGVSGSCGTGSYGTYNVTTSPSFSAPTPVISPTITVTSTIKKIIQKAIHRQRIKKSVK